jgi:putative ABC transport system substrate-binding protein
MVAVGEPVEVRLVESLAHPGGNVTGLSAEALTGNRAVELCQPGHEGQIGSNGGRRTPVGRGDRSVTIQSPDELDPLFGAMTRDRPESLLVLADTVTVANRQRTIEFAARNQVPAIYEIRVFVDDGGLMS